MSCLTVQVYITRTYVIAVSSVEVGVTNSYEYEYQSLFFDSYEWMHQYVNGWLSSVRSNYDQNAQHKCFSR